MQPNTALSKVTSRSLTSALFLQLVLLFFVGPLHAQTGSNGSVAISNSPAQAPNYRLRPNDQINVLVFDEPTLTVSQRIDGNGLINMPLLSTIKVTGLTIREVENLLEERFVSERYLRKPQVTVSIVGYAPRSIHIFGQVRNPGIQSFPENADSIDFIEVISRAGDFTDLARKDQVKVTRRDTAGNEKTFIIDAQKLIGGGKTRSSEDMQKFLIFPDDIIVVPEKGLF